MAELNEPNAPNEPVVATYAVAGMTCAHCVAAVTEEVSALPGVQSIDIDLADEGPSRVTVTSASPLLVDDVRAAVDEAGYALVES